jgi:TonB family protein
MNAVLNYLLEANLGLCLFLLVYVVLLRNETDFKLKRGYMLLAIIASVVLPLFHFNTTNNVLPSLGNFVPPTWLPEVVVEANGGPSNQETTLNFNVWSLTNFIYSVGVVASLILFLVRLSMLLKMIYKATTFKFDSFLIAESIENKSAFSFFQFIFIGQANQLSQQEKQQIIEHERVHVQQFHSVDILLMNVLSIFFWFNPVVKMYKKIFIQLHEFEADARAVENRDVNDYCTLLAKVALLSADFKIANHFSNSLTLKRIEMMRTIKSKIRGWKIMAILLILPAFFFVVSCQDQIMDDAQQIAEKSTIALDLPEEVQKALDDMKKANPTKKFVALEVDENDGQKAEAMKKRLAEIKPEDISSINVMKNKIDRSGNKRSFIIIEYNEMAEQLSERSKQDGDIFTIVEESATFEGGIEGLGTFIAKNLSYPEEARKKGLEGTVFVQFVVNTDGSLTDFTIIKGVDKLMDEEAMRVVEISPNWKPGKQNGREVRQRFVLPVRFKLDDKTSSSSSSALEIREVMSEFTVETSIAEKGDKKVITGTINDQSGNAVAGANIMNVGTTTGTVTDLNGNFTISVPKANGQLAVSFIGYKTVTIAF